MIFEGPMIIAAVVALTVFHPGICFGGTGAWKATKWSALKGTESGSVLVLADTQPVGERTPEKEQRNQGLF